MTTLNLFDEANNVASGGCHPLYEAKCCFAQIDDFLLIDLLKIKSPWIVDLQMNFSGGIALVEVAFCKGIRCTIVAAVTMEMIPQWLH